MALLWTHAQALSTSPRGPLKTSLPSHLTPLSQQSLALIRIVLTASRRATSIGTNARFGDPKGIAVDPRTGVVYVADCFNNNIRQLTPPVNCALERCPALTLLGHVDVEQTSPLVRFSLPLDLSRASLPVGTSISIGDPYGPNRVVIADAGAFTATLVVRAAPGTSWR